ncbi:lipopolysaccharide biosynthesis protein [Streptococcus suis]
MRTKLALKNTIASLILQVITAISGLIIPRFFTTQYGSAVNGLVSSISQFILYMGLVEAGISAAATVSLYKPLVEKRFSEISEVLSAAKLFYRRSGMMYLILLAGLLIFYPKMVASKTINIPFIQMMIIVLAANSVIDYFILGKYRVLLLADQRSYIISIAQVIGVILTTISSIILIQINANAIIVKAVAAIVYLLRTLYLVWFVNRNYKYLDLSMPPKKEAFSQRKNVLLHQIAGMICNNTDIIVLTIFLGNRGLVLASIYSLYNLVAYAVTNLFESLSLGVRSSFGHLISEKDNKRLNEVYGIFEFTYLILLFAVYTCMGLLLQPFIELYTKNYSDAELYSSMVYVVLFTLIGLVQNFRIPGSTIHVAAGHFKETQSAAIIEATINLVFSLTLVPTFGIAGVLIGTLMSYIYRTSYTIWYTNKYFFKGSLSKTISRACRSLVISVMIIIPALHLLTSRITTWSDWFVSGIVLFLIAMFFIGGINVLFEFKVAKQLLKRIKR